MNGAPTLYAGQPVRQVAVSQAVDIRPTGVRPAGKQPAGNVCPTCAKSFERLYNLKVHLRKHTGETPYDCPVNNCPKQFKWRSSMAHHVRAHHQASDLLASDLPVPAMAFASATSPGRPSSVNGAASTTSGMGSRRRRAVRPRTPRTPRVPTLKKNGVHKKTGRLTTTVTTAVAMVASSVEPAPLPGPSTVMPNQCGRAVLREMKKSDGVMDTQLPEALAVVQERTGYSLMSDRVDKVAEEVSAGGEKENGGMQLLDVVSELLERENANEAGTELAPYSVPLSLLEEDEVVNQVSDPGQEEQATVDESMFFLAVGSDDATDADMESLAQFDGLLVSPDGTPLNGELISPDSTLSLSPQGGTLSLALPMDPLILP